MTPGLSMNNSYQGYRALLVHAHPDDETINNGATMAMYAALGADLTLVTCTRGEEGEVLVPELAHYAAHETDQLGEHRVVELAEAMKALGITDCRALPYKLRNSILWLINVLHLYIILSVLERTWLPLNLVLLVLLFN